MKNELSFTAFDVETASEEVNSICQIGFVVVIGGIIVRRFSSLIKPPGSSFNFHNIRVHGIDNQKVLNAPQFNQIWQEISKYFNGHLVAHNASFDIKHLIGTLNFYNIDLPKFSLSCTYEKTGVSLFEACKLNQIDLHEHHDALADAEACAKVYLATVGYSVSILDSKIPFANKIVDKADLNPDFDNCDENSPFYRKKIIFTGDLKFITRRDAAHLIKKLGADVNTSISKKTDFAIVGSNPGPSKLNKIKEFSTKIITEEEFRFLIKPYL